MNSVAEVTLADAETRALETLSGQFPSLAALETEVLSGAPARRRIADALASIREQLIGPWKAKHHVIVRGVPACKDGSTGLLLALSMFAAPKPYRSDRIVKHFRMSPWTKALSHTLASGFFHTDINTADFPPVATIMQCLERDPGAPEYGQLRVATLDDLLAQLRATHKVAALRLLEQDRVTMVNETSPRGWCGAILNEGTIRFHPESLSAAQRRLGTNPPDLDDCLEVIHQAALAVSAPIDLGSGHVLIVSNRRALHQRGACTIRFRQFPRDFEAREVAVLHTLDEPA